LDKICNNQRLSDKTAKNVLNNDGNFELSGFRTLHKKIVAAHKLLILNNFIDFACVVGYGCK